MIEFPVSEDPYYVSRGPFVIQRAEKPLLIHVERFVPANVPGDEGYEPFPFGDPPAPPNNPEDQDYVEIPFILVVEPAGETACHVKAETKVYQAGRLVTEIEINSGDTSIKVEFSVAIIGPVREGGDVELLDDLLVWLEGSEPEEIEEIGFEKGRALKVDLSQVKRLDRLVVTQADVEPRPLAAVDKLSVDEKISYFYSLLPEEFGAN